MIRKGIQYNLAPGLPFEKLTLAFKRFHWIKDKRKWNVRQMKISSCLQNLSSVCATSPRLRLWKLQLMLNARKGPLYNLLTTQALISLRECAGWSEPSLPAYRINGYCSICRWTENVPIRFHGCTRSIGPSLFANGIRAFFATLPIIYGAVSLQTRTKLAVAASGYWREVKHIKSNQWLKQLWDHGNLF